MQELSTPVDGKGCVMTCSIRPPDDQDAEYEEKREDGLLFLHEYAIVRLEIPSRLDPMLTSEPLICVRNPHGEGEFNGRFSDSDETNMNEDLRGALKHTIADDGTWWMSFSEFANIFTHIDLCETFACRDDRISWHHSQNKVEIQQDMCGDSSECWFQNPRCRLELTSDSDIVVGVSQPSVKFISGSSNVNAKFGFRIVADITLSYQNHDHSLISARLPPHRIAQEANELQQHTGLKVADSDTAIVIAYQPPLLNRDVSVRVRLGPTVPLSHGGSTPVIYYIVPCIEWPDIKNGRSVPISIDVYAQSAFSLEPYTDGIFQDYHSAPCSITLDTVREWHQMEEALFENFEDSEEEAADTYCAMCGQDIPSLSVLSGCNANSEGALRSDAGFWCRVCEIDLCESCSKQSTRMFCEHEDPCTHELQDRVDPSLSVC
jgi:hypothetical protein